MKCHRAPDHDNVVEDRATVPALEIADGTCFADGERRAKRDRNGFGPFRGIPVCFVYVVIYPDAPAVRHRARPARRSSVRAEVDRGTCLHLIAGADEISLRGHGLDKPAGQHPTCEIHRPTRRSIYNEGVAQLIGDLDQVASDRVSDDRCSDPGESRVDVTGLCLQGCERRSGACGPIGRLSGGHISCDRRVVVFRGHGRERGFYPGCDGGLVIHLGVHRSLDSRARVIRAVGQVGVAACRNRRHENHDQTKVEIDALHIILAYA